MICLLVASGTPSTGAIATVVVARWAGASATVIGGWFAPPSRVDPLSQPASETLNINVVTANGTDKVDRHVAAVLLVVMLTSPCVNLPFR